MRAESEVLKHKWWHRFSWFYREFGLIQEGIFDEETGQPIYAVQRKVIYCLLCREQLYHGNPAKQDLDDYLEKNPQYRRSTPGGNKCRVVPLRPEPAPPRS